MALLWWQVTAPKPLQVETAVQPESYSGILPVYDLSPHLSQVPIKIVVGSPENDAVLCNIAWPTCDLDKITQPFSAKAILYGADNEIEVRSLVVGGREYAVTKVE